MDFGRLLSRAFNITLHHRALWLYGFLLALFGGGGSGINYQFGGGGGGAPSGQGTPPLPGNLGSVIPNAGAMAGLFAGLACLFLLLGIVAIVIQSVSRTALIGMADEVERTGDTTVREGWGYGWSRFAWRNFLINFLIGLAVFVVALVVGAIVVGLAVVSGLSLGALQGQADARTGLGVAAVVCLALLCIVPLFVALAVIVSSVVNLAQRHVVLRDGGVTDSIGAAWNLFRAHWANLVGLIIILFVLALVWSLLIWAIALAVGVSLAALPGLLVGSLTNRAWAGVVAALPGMIFLLISLGVLGALWVTFNETVWTLAYRELTGLGAPGTALTPAPAPISPAPVAE